MKLNLFFVLIDLLVILSIPLVFLWDTLTRLSKAVAVFQSSRRRRDQQL